MPAHGMPTVGHQVNYIMHRKTVAGSDIISDMKFFKPPPPPPSSYGPRWHQVAVYENEFSGRPAAGYSASELARLAAEFDWISAQSRASTGVFSPEDIVVLKAANPRLQIGVYVNGTHTAGAIGGGPDLARFPSNWFAKQADGVSYCFDARWGNYMMEPTSTGWRGWIATEAARRFNLSTYDFVFIDVMGWVARGEVKPGTTTLYTGLEWCLLTKLIARDIRVQIRLTNPVAIVESNGLKYGNAYFTQSYPLMDESDYGMPEQFSRSSTAVTERNVFQVIKELQMVDDVHLRGKHVSALTKDWRTTPDEERLRYGFGQYMLVACNLCSFAASLSQATELNSFPWLSDIDRGSPTGVYSQPSSGIFQRIFTKGTVVVNANATAWTGTVRSQAMSVPAYSSRWAMDP